MNDTYPVKDDDSKVVGGTLPFPSLAYSFMIRYYELDQYFHAVTPSGDVVRRMEVKSHQFKPLLCVAYHGSKYCIRWAQSISQVKYAVRY